MTWCQPRRAAANFDLGRTAGSHVHLQRQRPWTSLTTGPDQLQPRCYEMDKVSHNLMEIVTQCPETKIILLYLCCESSLLERAVWNRPVFLIYNSYLENLQPWFGVILINFSPVLVHSTICRIPTSSELCMNWIMQENNQKTLYYR